jgi:hypothetical protein
MNNTTQDDNKFFNKQFWRMTLIASFSQIIVLCIALTASLVISDKIDSLTKLFATANETLERVETSINTVIGIDPRLLQEKADGIAESATTVGKGVGDGGAETVKRVGEAFKQWREGKDANNEVTE